MYCFVYFFNQEKETMKVDRICFEQLFPTGVYANQRLRAEATIDDFEDMADCYKKLQQEVEKAFILLNPQIKWNELPTEIDYSKKEKIEIAIDNCTTIEELNKIMNEAFQNGLVNEFISKKKQLPV